MALFLHENRKKCDYSVGNHLFFEWLDSLAIQTAKILEKELPVSFALSLPTNSQPFWVHFNRHTYKQGDLK